MRLYKLIVILFCLVPLLITADGQALRWTKVITVDVDHIKQDLKDHPGKGDEHKKNYDKENPDADLSVAYADSIVWYSKYKFYVVEIEQLNPPGGKVNPFVQPISDMKSHPFPNGKEVVPSGPARKDLEFTGTGKAKATALNYYKITFNVNGEIVDPHIIIRP
jgi:hypothetical protein